MTQDTLQALDLTADVVDLAQELCDIESVSGNEQPIADAIFAALSDCDHLEVLRDGDAVVARTHCGRSRRVVVAGHIDTVPVADNLPTLVRGEGGERILVGRGTCDMKGGVAAALQCAALATEPTQDVTWVFYDNEEVEASRNGLGRISRNHPDWLAGEFAVLCEPTSCAIEGGCKGTMRVKISAAGVAAHSARAWIGKNAIHGLSDVLGRLAAYEPEDFVIDGLEYRECLNAVKISGGIAGNVVPDSAEVHVNYRFAPHRDPDAALEHVRGVFAGLDVDIEVTDMAAGARPGLDRAAAQDFVTAIAGQTDHVDVRGKQGWTDVARFSELGVPAVNYGPGDPLKAHAADEFCPAADIYACRDGLMAWLGGGSGSRA